MNNINEKHTDDDNTNDDDDTNVANVIKNNVGEYADEGKKRFRIIARPQYPTRNFVTSSIYTTNNDFFIILNHKSFLEVHLTSHPFLQYLL